MGQEVVHGGVSAGGGGKQVVAGVQNVGLGVGVIIAGQVLGGNGDGHVHAGSRLHLGLGGVKEHNGGFLHVVLLIVIGVGLLDVELGQEVAVLTAVVLQLHHGGDVSIGSLVYVHALEGLGVVQVGQTVAEGIEHLLAVIPGAVLGGALAGAGFRAGIHNGIVVAGLVIFVAHVDALGLHHEVAAVVGVAAAEGAGGLVADLHAGVAGIILAAHNLVVSVVTAAEVHHSGNGGVVGHIGVRQSAGGVHLAGEHPGDAGALVVVNHADVGDAVHLVPAALGDVLEHHGIAGVDEDDDLGAGFLGGVDDGKLVVGQGQRILAGSVAVKVQGGAGSVGIALAGAPGKYADAGGIGLVDGGLPVGGSAQLGELLGGDLHDLVLSHVAGGGHVDIVVGHLGLQLTGPAVGNLLGVFVEHLFQVEIPNGFVHLQPCIGEGLEQVHRVLIARLQIAGGIGIGGVGRQAEQGHGAAVRQGERAVVILHDDGTLFALFNSQGLGSGHHVVDGGVVALEAGRVGVGVGDVALGAQGVVDPGAEGIRHPGAHHGQHQYAGHDGCDAPHNRRETFCSHHYSSLFFHAAGAGAPPPGALHRAGSEASIARPRGKNRFSRKR